MRIALDTNRYRDLCDADPAVIAMLERAESILVPFVVIAELRAGFAIGKRMQQNEQVLRRFLNKPGVSVLYATDATTRGYANLYRQLRSQGTPIPTNDLWIGALVVEHDLALLTRDRHFAHLPQLTLLGVS
ncbi:MAG: type II toxin-antitoxin system VapC family toxin [Deltaproteobacteria bacterium]|nr:type II toxin-antitoxin system VapC family toxin [Deltaproteobacteria bacterium]